MWTPFTHGSATQRPRGHLQRVSAIDVHSEMTRSLDETHREMEKRRGEIITTLLNKGRHVQHSYTDLVEMLCTDVRREPRIRRDYSPHPRMLSRGLQPFRLSSRPVALRRIIESLRQNGGMVTGLFWPTNDTIHLFLNVEGPRTGVLRLTSDQWSDHLPQFIAKIREDKTINARPGLHTYVDCRPFGQRGATIYEEFIRAKLAGRALHAEIAPVVKQIESQWPQVEWQRKHTMSFAEQMRQMQRSDRLDVPSSSSGNAAAAASGGGIRKDRERAKPSGESFRAQQNALNSTGERVTALRDSVLGGGLAPGIESAFSKNEKDESSEDDDDDDDLTGTKDGAGAQWVDKEFKERTRVFRRKQRQLRREARKEWKEMYCRFHNCSDEKAEESLTMNTVQLKSMEDYKMQRHQIHLQATSQMYAKYRLDITPLKDCFVRVYELKLL